MVLLNNVIQTVALANFHTPIFVNIVLFDDGCVGAAFVDIDQTGFAVGADSLVQKS